MKIYFVRHGITDSNIEKRVMGFRVDEPLNESGREEAEALAASMEARFDVLITSPLKRAYETAEALGRRFNLPVTTHAGLHERDFGELSGKTWDEIRVVTKGTLSRERSRQEREIDLSPWGGETKESVRERLVRFIEYVKTEHSGRRIVVVTHAGVLRVLHAMHDRSLAEPIPNLAVFEFEI